MRRNELPRGLRNNNPGNIRNSDAIDWKGEVFLKKDNDFEEFEDIEHGYRAMFILVRNYILKHGLNTIRGIISRYAPNHENHTENYIDIVSDRSGIGADDVISADNREIMIRIIAAMSYVENGRDAVMSDVIAGWNLL